MYEHLFSHPTTLAFEMAGSKSNTGMSVVNTNNLANETFSKIEYALRKPNMQEVSGQYGTGSQIKRGVLASNNVISGVSASSLSNDYLLDQKLRNVGIYTKLKNKTMYAKSEFVSNHASLNSGIL